MKTTQQELETMFSQRNIHEILHRSVEYELDKAFINWSLGAYLRINEYLEGDYYLSKNRRIAELKAYTDDNGLDRILIALLVGVIRTKRDSTIQQAIGYLQSYIPHEDHFDRAKTAGELIAICSGENRLFRIERLEYRDSPMIIVNYWDVLYETFEEEFEFIEDTFYNPPLIEKPKKVTSRHNCGYHSFNEPVILGQHTQHEDQLDLETINILNQTPWVIDPLIAALPEVPSKPIDDLQERMNFRMHAATARRLYNILGSDPFYLGWQYDSRGRLYSHGHHVNLQSYEYKKALLSHNHFEKITV